MAVNSIFSTDTSKPITVRAGKAIVKVGGATLLALNVQLNFQRSVELIPTLSKKRVMSVGEGQGSFSAETVLSKENNIESAFRLNEDGCSPFAITITFKDSSCSENGKTVTAHNCVASAISIGAQGGRGYIAEGLQATFTGLTV